MLSAGYREAIGNMVSRWKVIIILHLRDWKRFIVFLPSAFTDKIPGIIAIAKLQQQIRISCDRVILFAFFPNLTPGLALFGFNVRKFTIKVRAVNSNTLVDVA
jgi:hypothetical protein